MKISDNLEKSQVFLGFFDSEGQFQELPGPDFRKELQENKDCN